MWNALRELVVLLRRKAQRRQHSRDARRFEQLGEALDPLLVELLHLKGKHGERVHRWAEMIIDNSQI